MEGLQKVYWAMMSYAEISQKKLIEQVSDWITDEIKPEDKHPDYIKYLKNFCGFPSNFTGRSEL